MKMRKRKHLRYTYTSHVEAWIISWRRYGNLQSNNFPTWTPY